MVAGSSKPQASKNFSSCSRAASSFQVRSRRMIPAARRRPARARPWRSARWRGRSGPGNRCGSAASRALQLPQLRLGLAALLGQRQRAAGAGDLGVLGQLRRHLGQRLAAPRPRRPSASRARIRPPQASAFSGSCCSRALNSSPACSASPSSSAALRLGEQVGAGHRAAGELQQRLDEALDLGFRQRALEQVGDLALPEGGDGGHRLQRQAELGELARPAPGSCRCRS